jgi:hypothetical protein
MVPRFTVMLFRKQLWLLGASLAFTLPPALAQAAGPTSAAPASVSLIPPVKVLPAVKVAPLEKGAPLVKGFPYATEHVEDDGTAVRSRTRGIAPKEDVAAGKGSLSPERHVRTGRGPDGARTRETEASIDLAATSGENPDGALVVNGAATSTKAPTGQVTKPIEADARLPKLSVRRLESAFPKGRLWSEMPPDLAGFTKVNVPKAAPPYPSPSFSTIAYVREVTPKGATQPQVEVVLAQEIAKYFNIPAKVVYTNVIVLPKTTLNGSKIFDQPHVVRSTDGPYTITDYGGAFHL